MPAAGAAPILPAVVLRSIGALPRIAPWAVVKEGDIMRSKTGGLDWNLLIQSLVLVRLGQELGTDTPFARAVHQLLDAILRVCR